MDARSNKDDGTNAKTQHAATLSENANNNEGGAPSTLTSCSDESAISTTIGLPAPRLYSRLHLFGLPQELRDLIYVEVFDCELVGAEHLRPLLVCRQFYAEAEELAWKNAIFDPRQLSKDHVEGLRSTISPKVAARKVLGLEVDGNQLLSLKQAKLVLPETRLFRVSTPRVRKSGKECWYSAFVCLAAFQSRCDSFLTPSSAFTNEIIDMAEVTNLLFRMAPILSPLVDLDPSDTPITEVTHIKLDNDLEFYKVLVRMPGTAGYRYAVVRSSC